VLLGRSAVSFRSLLVLFGGLLVRVLRHDISWSFWGSQGQRSMLLVVPKCGEKLRAVSVWGALPAAPENSAAT
jgi:hypothetical protein